MVWAMKFWLLSFSYQAILSSGPTLGANRDTEVDGVHSTGANGDDNTGSPDDEDGVTFGTIRAGALGATATVNVAGGSTKLDAWIDFDRDGAWGGPLEQIADSVSVFPGVNTLTFDVPSSAVDGTTYARFRLSTAGNLGMGGLAADGEVEDYAVTVQPPKAACGCFGTFALLGKDAEGRPPTSDCMCATKVSPAAAAGETNYTEKP